MAGDVAGSFDDEKRTVEFAFGEEACGACVDAGEAASDLFVGLAGLERFIWWFLQQREGARVGGELDPRGAKFREEGVDGADVVDVGVGEEDAADGSAEGLATARMSSWELARFASMRVKPSVSRTR